jgi:YHS domain-containing protein
MKRYAFAMLALSAMWMSVVIGAEPKLDKAKCPVSGKEVKAASAADYKGGKVYFCCDGCPDAFKKDTPKYSTKANHQLALTGQAKEVKCPLAGRDLNPDTAIDIAGAKVAFCCNNCKGKASKASGDEQLELVFSDKAFEKGFKVGEEKKK